MKPRPLISLFPSCVFIASCAVLHAANIVWDGGPGETGTDWTVGANWVDDLSPADNITTDNAYFNTLTGGQPVLDAARSVAGIELETPTGGWTIGGAGTLTLGAKGIDATAFENGTNAISVANIVLGSATASSWTLSVSANSFTQPTVNSISSNIQLHETAQLQINSSRGGTGGTGTVNLSGVISNTTGKTTSGQLKFLGGSASRNFFNVTGANTYTGSTLISQAEVRINSLADDGMPSALGSSGIINVTENSSFSTLVFNGTAPASTNRRLTIGLASTSATGASNITNNAATANTLSFTGTASIINGGSGNRQFVLNGSNTGNNIFAQSIDNAGTGKTTFTKQNAGRWILSNPANTYTGATTLAGGFLHVSKLADGGNNSCIGAAASDAANLVFNGGELTYTGTGDSTDRLMTFNAGGNITNNGSGPLSFTNTGFILHTGSTARAINLGGTNNTDTNTFAPQIVDGIGTAITSVSSRGGKWALTNSNTFTGGVVFGTASTTGGTLVFGDDAALGAATGAITFTGSGNLVASGNATLGAARTITVSAGRAANFGILSGSGTVLTVDAKITGAGGVSRVSGSAFSTGSVRYANDANDYTGTFSTRFGISEFTSIANAGSPSALGAGSAITADNSASGAVLRQVGSNTSSTDRPIIWAASTGQFYLENDSTGTLSFSSTSSLVNADGNKTFSLGGTNTGDNTLAQPIGDGPGSGTTSLLKYGGGKWILTATCGYSGTTTINGGTLALGADATIANSPTITLAGGATLDLTSKTTAVTIPVTQTLSGSGSVTGPGLDVAGALVPGANGIGTLTTGAVTLGSTALLAAQISSSALACDQLDVIGNLAIDPAAMLNLTDAAAVPTATPGHKFVLASYTGTLSGHFADLPEGSVVTVGVEDYTLSYTDSNRITLTNEDAPADPYADWIGSFTALTTTGQRAKTADPDGDGRTNLEEFAFDGDPANGADSGKIQSSIATVGATRHLTLTVPVRSGAVFSGSPSLQSAPVDGVVYSIRGSLDLAAFEEAVAEVTPAIANSPALNPGWTYRTFRLSANTSIQPRGFLRAGISEPAAP